MPRPNRVSVLLSALVAAALLALPTPAGTDEASERFSFATYRERTERITLLAEGFQASLHDGDAFVPIPVAIGVRGKGPKVVVTLESFTLIDQEGNAHPAAAFETVLSRYPKLEFDRSLLRLRPLVIGQQFDLGYRVPSRFYPHPGAGLYIPRVELSRSAWFSDVIYFPRPEAGLGGVLTLRFRASGMEQPVEVRLRVPLRPRERA